MPGDVTGLSTLGALVQESPKVPAFVPIDVTKQQSAAVKGNLLNFDNIANLAGQTNQFNQDQLNKMLESAIPGYKSMVGNIGGAITGLVNGEIPKDISDQIGRNSAYRSLSGGFGGSGMARNLVARDLGLTSLDLISKGIDAGSRWLSTVRQSAVAPAFDASSMFITPAQRIGVTQWNKENQFNRDWMKNQIDAEYSTGTIMGRGLSDLGQGITGLATSAAGSAGGAAGGAI